MINWHCLFGLALSDLLTDSPWIVELEKDLSQKKQLLDVVILRRRDGTFEGRLPDGLEHLVDHNLLTFKSLHEPLDNWALKELTGHYVNYRKVVSPPKLLAEDRFRMFAVAVRFPQRLARSLPLELLSPGVYAAVRGTDRIILIVLAEIRQEEHNSFWNLFSAKPEVVSFGKSNYHPKSTDTSTILNRLLEAYELEGISMPYTMEDFRRDTARDYLHLLSPDERLKGLKPEEIEAFLKKLKAQPTRTAKRRPAKRRPRRKGS